MFRRCLITAMVPLLCVTLSAAARDVSARPAAPLDPPQVVFRELFVAVQTAGVFADGKVFADAIARTAPERILAEYRRSQPMSPAALKAFVDANFSMPSPITPAATTTAPEEPSLANHIDRLWDVLTRTTTAVPPHSSLLPLPHPYVVPGGRFREMYYWDSYFTMLGLVQSGRIDLAQDMVRNFAYLIDTFGHVPNGTRTYYLSRSQPPFFFAMVALLAPDDAAAAYARYLPQLKREYAFWMAGATSLRAGTASRRVVALADGSILNRYWDDRDTPRDESYRDDVELARGSVHERRQLFRNIRAAAESGWDFGSRWFADPHDRATIDTTDIVPIDLNALLFGLETAIATGCTRSGDAACAGRFTESAARRRSGIDRFLWDAAAATYRDYRWTRHERVPRDSAAMLYPLFVGMSSNVQAAGVAAAAERELLRPGGLVTTAIDSGQQWDSPNGWAPLQWIAVDGLRRYGAAQLAATIACRWMSGVNRLYRDSGKLVEKYDVVDVGRRGGGGEYPSQDGFGWTNGVMRKLITLYPSLATHDDASACTAVQATARAAPVAAARTTPVAVPRVTARAAPVASAHTASVAAARAAPVAVPRVTVGGAPLAAFTVK